MSRPSHQSHEVHACSNGMGRLRGTGYQEREAVLGLEQECLGRLVESGDLLCTGGREGGRSAFPTSI